MRRFSFLLAALLASAPFFAAPSSAQNFVLEQPEVSPAATVSQRVGLTDIAIDYHRPGVNKRTIWGGLVPWNEVWRAGANENTVISFSTPVSIGGKTLEAGDYGLHMIPTEKDWTIIFSRQARAWGSFSYDEKEDAARITVTPEAGPFVEKMSYTMDDPTDKSVTVALNWDTLRVPFTIDVPLETVASELREQLRGLPRFYWQGWNQAAAWCLRNNVNLDEALTWSEKSLAQAQNYNNLSVRAGLLEKKGDTAEAAKLREKALTLATEADLNNYGYQLMGQGKTEEAIAVFVKNVKTYPESWNAYDSLAEAYAQTGKKSDAVTNYRKALAIVQDATQKKRIETEIGKLQ